jgi:hypothetical protein
LFIEKIQGMESWKKSNICLRGFFGLLTTAG